MSKAKENDFRKLSISAQSALRKVAFRGLKSGLKQKEVAGLVGVTRQTISEWVSKAKKDKTSVIAGGLRGRREGQRRILTEQESVELQQLIKETYPEEHNIKSALWSRKSIGSLIQQKFGRRLPISTIGLYLSRFGFTAQKPKKQAYEQQPCQIQRWLDNDYPMVLNKAKKENAELHWGDETGLKSECQDLRGYAPTGQTPVIKHKSRRFSINMISTVTNQGKLRFMTYEGTMRAEVFIEFLRRLIKYAKKKIYLIVDNLKVHHARKVRSWVAKHCKRISLYFLPPYAPQYNPDEYLNNDLKRNVNRNHIPFSKDDLKKNINSYLRKLQYNKEHIKSLFKADYVKYAAA